MFKLIAGVLVASNLVHAKTYTYRQMADLFKGANLLEASQLPGSGVLKGTGAMSNGRTGEDYRVFKKSVDAKGVATLRFGRLVNPALSPEDAVRHFEACAGVMPAAETWSFTSGGRVFTILQQWDSFANIRRWDAVVRNTYAQSYDLYRAVGKGTASEAEPFLLRTDVSDPGFIFSGAVLSPLDVPAAAYLVVESVTEAKASAVAADCRLLAPNQYWVQVSLTSFPPHRKWPRL